eukprot:CAMPEP_0167752914 /NCGR_PEP_ID=MMETSP0110_2-20121227/7412_1 /TAXON_ID=629695 /ORGANISM="Gymnochlora sp., Strain CCMP2014" /LENGTH=56 /DNA_ID=CAMNT_0007638601 /DNA_START=184 /DNA_END=354 /DNA_ORIENTATION=+
MIATSMEPIKKANDKVPPPLEKVGKAVASAPPTCQPEDEQDTFNDVSREEDELNPN